VFQVQCRDIEAQVESGCSDDQVFDGDGDSVCSLFALNLSGKLSDGERDGVYDQSVKDILREDAAAFALGPGLAR